MHRQTTVFVNTIENDHFDRLNLSGGRSGAHTGAPPMIHDAPGLGINLIFTLFFPTKQHSAEPMTGRDKLKYTLSVWLMR
jgi:hypothetical protein